MNILVIVGLILERQTSVVKHQDPIAQRCGVEVC
jgi:hypothetical protein